ncbi:MAG: hypothetical protein AAGJ08_12505 [Cyanobacteria bacterium P01_H01_bin.35]
MPTMRAELRTWIKSIGYYRQFAFAEHPAGNRPYRSQNFQAFPLISTIIKIFTNHLGLLDVGGELERSLY